MTGEDDAVIARTRAWVDRAVIGLNLCPFAKAPQVKGLVRYVVSAATDPAALLADFDDYLAFVEIAEDTVAELDLEGVLQVASFHPQYRFAGTSADDIGNATNRSPSPTLHLIREESIDRAVAAFPEAEAIYETNIETLRRLGPAGWAALQQQCRDDAAAAQPAGSAAAPPAGTR